MDHIVHLHEDTCVEITKKIKRNMHGKIKLQ